MSIFEQMESEVRTYARSFPTVFARSKGSYMYDEDGKAYLDFFAGAGALNYGHNNDYIKSRVLEFMTEDNITHALDMSTSAKGAFLEKFNDEILKPRGYDYKVMFCGPTGTNAVESALKLARKVKKRNTVFTFMGAYHGMTVGSLALTSNRSSRDGAGIALENAVFLPPFDGFSDDFDSIDYMAYVLENDHSGIAKPAAVIVESIQAEGGIVIASAEWLQRLRKLCDEHDILLIVDDIQVGCGRVGTYFSFEESGIVPDMVTLSKSISGYGMPMSILLMNRELDIWKAGEHTSTFRGYQPAFVGASAAIDYLKETNLLDTIPEKEKTINTYFENNILNVEPSLKIRGKGLIHGIDFENCGGGELAGQVAKQCFSRGLIIERCGKEDCVLKILPPLTTTVEELEKGMSIIRDAIVAVMG